MKLRRPRRNKHRRRRRFNLPDRQVGPHRTPHANGRGARGSFIGGGSDLVIYATVCSGIEAPTVAWHALGFTPAAFSEIDPFASAVLAHRYPGVPNVGDMTTAKWEDHRGAVELVCGGTPCQSFSVAGLRKGLDDPRGNLTLAYLAVVDAIRPRWVVWENVPGVLSDRTGAFGAFLGGLAELGYGFAYRVLDAQYFGVPQRRRRVFVVGYFGNWRPAAAVLFERASLSGHPAPRREAGERTAPTISARTRGGGGLGTDFDLDGGLIARAVKATEMGHRHDPSTDNYVVTHALSADGFDASEDGTGRGTPIVPVLAFDTTQITSKTNRSGPEIGEPCHPLAAAAHPPAIAFDCKASGRNGFGVGETAPTLRAMGHKDSHTNAGGQVAVALQQNASGELRLGDAAFTLSTNTSASGRNTAMAMTAMQVRRLTPRECERLQGFPDDYTLIPYRGKLAADGPRYKSLGNSMAVPVMRWIGMRIATVDRIVLGAVA